MVLSGFEEYLEMVLKGLCVIAKNGSHRFSRMYEVNSKLKSKIVSKMQ
jgi:hypothetical protein